jgi:hypothetical protein
MFLVLVLVYGVVNYGETFSSIVMNYFEPAEEIQGLTKTNTPHLWSDFKVLEIDAELCAMKGKNILESLSFKSMFRNLKYDKA